MNNLVLFQTVDAVGPDFPDRDIRFEWKAEIPSIGDVVGMLGVKDWVVCKVSHYKPVQAVDYSLVLCDVVRADLTLPPEPEWQWSSIADYYPHQSVTVFLSELGITPLDFLVNFQDEQPTIGEEVASFMFEGAALHQPVKTGWAIERFDTFLPTENSPHRAIYLAWCEKLALTLA